MDVPGPGNSHISLAVFFDCRRFVLTTDEAIRVSGVTAAMRARLRCHDSTSDRFYRIVVLGSPSRIVT